MHSNKYRPYKTIKLSDRTWPDNILDKAPIWCSVDLRDGNQALSIPMTLEQKLEFFVFLVKIGFKEIEVGFPAASDTEFMFARELIERNLIPDDVTIQVLTQSRRHIIERTFEALKGAKQAIVHLYNSTSTLQRDVVFNKSKEEIIQLAVDGAKLVKALAAEDTTGCKFRFEYSPESFTGTEMDYAVEISNAVLEIFEPSPDNEVILNLPSTVEMDSPNVFADQIEYVCRNLKNREDVIISLHAHNDRGCAVAASELGLLAGAQRVEGTLFGNGERTGNADLMNIALNLYSHGIDPKLDFSEIQQHIDIYERSTGLIVHPRHPYAGELVYTAFSGSHQDAIRKGMERTKTHPDYWEVPYLPIDPRDVGRSYEPIIRINSQSGKGGVAFVLEQNFGLYIPKSMQKDFGLVVTNNSDTNKSELLRGQIFELFEREYINIDAPVKYIKHSEVSVDEHVDLTINLGYDGKQVSLNGTGNGILSAFCHCITEHWGFEFEITNYSEHSMDYGSRSRAITYVEIMDSNKNVYFGAGVSGNISRSSVKAVLSAINKRFAVKAIK